MYLHIFHFVRKKSSIKLAMSLSKPAKRYRSEEPEKASSLPRESKTLLVRIYLEEKKEGVSIHHFLERCSNAGYPIPRSSFERWLTSFNRTGHAVKLSPESGRLPSLTSEERLIMAGWVLSQNETNTCVNLSDYTGAVAYIFRKDISAPTAQRYLAQDGFAFKTLKMKKSGYTLDHDSMADILWGFVDSCRQSGYFKRWRSKICSIDFTYTSHRTGNPQGYGPIGHTSPKTTKKVPSFTNCIITCIWADGKNHTPAVLFTFNPKFRRDLSKTVARCLLEKALDAALEEYDINPNRVVYVGKPKGEKRTYVPETAELVRLFFGVYGVEPKTIIFSDEGNSFKEGAESVLDKLGFEKHITYPPSVHQYLSPNDNKLHGTAKSVWKKQKEVKFIDDVRSSCLLLSLLDRDTQVHSKTWFEKNILHLQREEVSAHIHGCTEARSKWGKEAMRAYKQSQGIDVRDLREIPKQLHTTLDGLHYETILQKNDRRGSPNEKKQKN